ncbi:type III restriction enzyme [Spirochaetota bacterium]|nr:type III restriction enzyme [Spirochaetota bacterium]
MSNDFLHKEYDSLEKHNTIKKEIPKAVLENLNPKFQIRPYQRKAFNRFFYYLEDAPDKITPIHLLFNMATGSGKTLMMAGLILYLYEKGYRNFLFFVNSTNILEKTKDNFLNKNSSKYLFNEQILFEGQEVRINEVSNFNQSIESDINIFFTTIQGLHGNLKGIIKENAITDEDFSEQKIVLLSDEAHHLNVATKGQLSEDEQNWEETVQGIFNKDRENILLEFTATIDLNNQNIIDKYRDKILYKYDLPDFRKDKYSKEIKTLSLDSSLDQVMLHAALLSQYRLKIAEKYGITLKPVILFKAQKTIEQSNTNEETFKRLIKNLNIKQLEKLLSINFLPKENTILVDAFSYLDDIYETNYQNLIAELQRDFSDEKIINVNDEASKKDNQILLNSLEDNSNPIRAIFAVNKLNEGWDVLNLFDIVRVYDTRDGNWQKGDKYKAGCTTLSEAQLIGRGARYYPFSTSDEEDIFTRKYDEDTENELKILEELHYHSKYNSRYLEEMQRVMVEQGLIDEKNTIIKERVKIKDTTEESFYNKRVVFKNKPIVNDNKDKRSFEDYGIKSSYPFKVTTDKIRERNILGDQWALKNPEKDSYHRVLLKDIEKIIFYKAFNQNKDFWNFANLKKYFGNLESVNDLLSDKYFYRMTLETNREFLSREEKLSALNKILPEISDKIKKNAIYKKGSIAFHPEHIHKIFRESKELRFNASNKQFKSIDIDQIKDFFLHDKLWGTSEEENFIRFFTSYIKKLTKKYKEIKLLRNHRELKIYRFSDGKAFEPDFLLFLTKNNGKELSYQVFIEPKGDHLIKYDKEKEDFLKEIKSKYHLEVLDGNDYKLLGLRFYNKNKEIEFEKDFEKELLH